MTGTKRALVAVGGGVVATVLGVVGYQTLLATKSTTDLQTLINAASPGTTVQVPLATYQTGTLSSSGVAVSLNKAIVLDGQGSVIRGQGWPAGLDNTSGSSALIQITATGATLKNFVLENARNHALLLTGNKNLIEEVTIRDCWEDCIRVSGDDNTLRYVEVHNARHGTGLELSLTGAERNLIERSISHDNGREPDGTKVSVISGDPAGGGNSDGMGYFKDCQPTVGGPHTCLDNRWLHNISYRNTDDGFDITASGPLTEFRGNIAFRNGPTGRRGYKMFRPGRAQFYGNVAVGPETIRCLEARSDNSGTIRVWNFTGLKWGESGACIEPVTPPSWMDERNTLESKTGSGIANPDYEPPLWRYDYPQPTVQARWTELYQGFREAYQAAGPAVDAGRVIPGYHCPSAGMGDGTCVEWLGSAPDLGAFEGGLVVTPPPPTTLPPPPSPPPSPDPGPTPTPTPAPTPTPTPSPTPTPTPTPSPSTVPTTFTMTLSASTLTVPRGGQVSLTVNLQRSGGFSAPVTLSSVPAGAIFLPNPVIGSAAALAMTIPLSYPVGTYTVTIKAVGSGITRTAPFTLKVT